MSKSLILANDKCVKEVAPMNILNFSFALVFMSFLIVCKMTVIFIFQISMLFFPIAGILSHIND